MTVYIDPNLQNFEDIEYNAYTEDQIQLEDQATSKTAWLEW